MLRLETLFCGLLIGAPLLAQAAESPSSPRNANDTPIAYPLPYAPASVDEIRAVLNRILVHLDAETPVRVTDLDSKKPATDLDALPPNPGLDPTSYGLISYEWGVTYSGMLLAGKVLDDARFRDYAATRLEAIAAVAARQRPRLAENPSDSSNGGPKLRRLIEPQSLDNSGAICASMIQAAREDIHPDELRPCIDTLIHWITKGQSRLDDGTLDRQHPMPHSLWLDDLYMSVPALAQMGALTGKNRYFDDAVRQITQFSARMFIPEKGLFRHGWVEQMNPHPAFHWGRANGWAIVAMAELLSVLPEDHPGRAAVLKIYRAQAKSLASLQDKTGRWHQLLDRSDTYLETSASAMFVYAIARGVNRGWLDAYAYGPMLSLGWNAVAQQVNAQGQIEGVCIGTGMGWDPAFYSYRPTNVWASHGYGPVLLAGAEMITLRRGKGAKAFDGNENPDGKKYLNGVQFYAPSKK